MYRHPPDTTKYVSVLNRNTDHKLNERVNGNTEVAAYEFAYHMGKRTSTAIFNAGSILSF